MEVFEYHVKERPNSLGRVIRVKASSRKVIEEALKNVYNTVKFRYKLKFCHPKSIDYIYK